MNVLGYLKGLEKQELKWHFVKIADLLENNAFWNPTTRLQKRNIEDIYNEKLDCVYNPLNIELAKGLVDIFENDNKNAEFENYAKRIKFALKKNKR